MTIETWQQRVGEHYNDSRDETEHEIAMQAEIADLRGLIKQLEDALRAAQDDMEQVGMYDDKIDYVSHEKAVATVGAALDACEP